MECRFYNISSQVFYLSRKGRVATTRNSFDEIKSDGDGSSYYIGSCDRAEFNLTCFHHTSCKDSTIFYGQTVRSGTSKSQVFMENSVSECPEAKESYRAVVWFIGQGGTPQIEVKQNNISHCRLGGHTAIEFHSSTKSHCSMNTIFKNELDDVYCQYSTPNEVTVERENIVENQKNSGSKALFNNGAYTVESCVIISNNYTSLYSKASTFSCNEFYGNTFSVPSSTHATHAYEYITDWGCVVTPEPIPSESFSLPKETKLTLMTQFMFLICTIK